MITMYDVCSEAIALKNGQRQERRPAGSLAGESGGLDEGLAVEEQGRDVPELHLDNREESDVNSEGRR